MLRVIGDAALAVLNPSLLAAVGVMLVLPHAERLMLGYLLGAYLTSLAVGFAVVFWLHGTGIVSTTKHKLGPGADVLLGLVGLGLSLILATHRDAQLRDWGARRRQRRRERKPVATVSPAPPQSEKDSWHRRMLATGSMRMSFLVGAVLSFPGVSYLNALHQIVRLNPGVLVAILLVIFFCVMQQLLLELPLIGYVVAPEATLHAVTRSRSWLQRSGRRIAIGVLGALGVLLIVRGAITFVG